MILCTPSHPLPHSFFKKNTPYVTHIGLYNREYQQLIFFWPYMDTKEIVAKVSRPF